MEISFRPLCLFNRLFRKPLRIPAYKSISNTVVKDEFSPELLNSFNRDIKAGGAVPVFKRALLFPNRIALQDECGSYSYGTLYQAAAALSKDIAAELLGERQRTISYMCGNDASHVIVQWAIWMSGNIAVPLTPIHPEDMLKYFIGDSGSDLIICSQDYEKILRPIAHSLSKPLITTTRSDEKVDQNTGTLSEVGQSNSWYGDSDAMLIYTSGTTSQPKGVVWTHSMLSHQITALHSAWQYSAQDVVLHTLPLHHIHGQLNSLNATLAAGARIRMLPSFSSPTVWARLLTSGDREDPPIKVFHGVPAMYTRLANDYDKMFADNKTRTYVRNTLSSRMRLMCAGSAPLPETLFKKWEEITGVRLLERYGMSEVGMALSNPYRPVEGRAVGCVGVPLPGVNAALAVPLKEGGLKKIVTVESDMPDLQVSLEKLGLSTEKLVEDTEWKVTISEVEPNELGVYEGELLLKGPAVFTRYWNRAPKPDSEDFTPDGWFRTGDVASFSEGKFKILGRLSVDIIKTGGYKVSALQVEAAILEHPNVLDVAVVGIVDDSYGEIVACVIVLKENTTLTLKEIKDSAGKKLAPYQLPKTMLFVDEMPRNAMGKLDKKLIMRKFGDKLVLKS